MEKARLLKISITQKNTDKLPVHTSFMLLALVLSFSLFLRFHPLQHSSTPPQY